jgi:hypothetical protein
LIKNENKNLNKDMRKTTFNESPILTAKHLHKTYTCVTLEDKNGNFTFTYGLNFGSRATLQCYKKFKVSSKYRTSDCLPNGLWSHFGNYSLSCDPIQCPFINDILNGKVVIHQNLLKEKFFIHQKLKFIAKILN